MRIGNLRLAVTILAALSLLALGLGRFTAAPAAQAQNYHTNPAPFAGIKAPISPAGLLGYQRQQVSQVGANFTTGGGNDNAPPYMAQPLRAHASAANATYPTSSGGATPPGSIDFNNDPSAEEQNETTVTVQQEGVPPYQGNATENHVVGGTNDFRGFYYAPQYGCSITPGSQCYPAGNCPSLSGFSVSLDGGKSLAKNGCLPFPSSNPSFQPFGDPALDRDTQGNVYMGSLSFDTTANSGLNGIVIYRSTPALFDPSNACQNSMVVSGSSTTPSSNPCWTGRVVSVDNQGTAANGVCKTGYCVFDDKDWVAVDRYSNTPYRGDVYIAWNQFTVAGTNNGQSHIVLSRCTPSSDYATYPSGFSSCTTPMTVSMPGDDFTGGGSYLTVGRDGHVYVSYYNFGTTTTLYPIVGRVAVLSPGATSVLGYVNVANLTQDGNSTTYPCLPNTDPAGSFYSGSPCKDNMYPGDAAGVPFRLPGFIKVDADRTTGAYQNRIYVTYELCSVPQYYPSFDSNGNITYPGNCPKLDVIVTHFNAAFGSGGALIQQPVSYVDITPSTTSVSYRGPNGVSGQQFFPYVSVDDATGDVFVSYESTQNDPFFNMIDVYVQQSRDGGQTWFYPTSYPTVTQGRVTQSSYQVSGDPASFFGQGAPSCTGFSAATGCPGYAPENGDYNQGLAAFGRLFETYGATYVQKAFNAPANEPSFFDNTLPMHQDDNFLSVFPYTR